MFLFYPKNYILLRALKAHIISLYIHLNTIFLNTFRCRVTWTFFIFFLLFFCFNWFFFWIFHKIKIYFTFCYCEYLLVHSYVRILYNIELLQAFSCSKERVQGLNIFSSSSSFFSLFSKTFKRKMEFSLNFS